MHTLQEIEITPCTYLVPICNLTRILSGLSARWKKKAGFHASSGIVLAYPGHIPTVYLDFPYDQRSVLTWNEGWNMIFEVNLLE